MRNFHVGTMGWSYEFWKGGFYPDDLNSAKFLEYYSKQFDTVEVDSTFYRIPSEHTILEWKKQVPSDFLFSLKFPRKITHIKMLQNADEETTVFLKRAKLLGENLGSLLIQLPPNFKDEKYDTLRGFLDKLPNSFRYAIEVRNRTMLCPELYKTLRRLNVALAWADSFSNPAVLEKTGEFIYVRWEGDRKKVNGTLGKVEADQTSYTETWAEKLRSCEYKGTQIFGYFSKYYSGLPTEDAQQLRKFLETN